MHLLWDPLVALGIPWLTFSGPLFRWNNNCFVGTRATDFIQSSRNKFFTYEKPKRKGTNKKRDHISNYRWKSDFLPKPWNDPTVLAVILVCITSGFHNILGPILPKEFPHIRDIVEICVSWCLHDQCRKFLRRIHPKHSIHISRHILRSAVYRKKTCCIGCVSIWLDFGWNFN